jgi:hypothetical protein
MRNWKGTWIAFAGIGLVIGLASGCGQPDESDGMTESAESVSQLASCALGYFNHLGFASPRVSISPFLTFITGSLVTTHPEAYWMGTFSFAREAPQEFWMDSDQVCNWGNAAHRPRNPPGGSGETKAQCQGCYWTPVHSDHPHFPCPGNHRHLICKNWSESKMKCFHNSTGQAECL